MKRKIAVVCFSRANYARIKSVLLSIQKHPDLELLLIVGASALLYRYGKVIDIVEKDGFKISAQISSCVEGNTPSTMATSTGLSIIELVTAFTNLKPDIVLTVADRHETMATAIATSYMNIPLAHTQGGEVSGSIDESVRHAITKLAHIHFPATKRAAKVIEKLGENPEMIFMTGCPAIDLLVDLRDLSDFDINSEGVGAQLNLQEPFSMVVQHPVTNEFIDVKRQIKETIDAIKYLIATYDHQFIWLWPNIDAGSDYIAQQLRSLRENSNKNLNIRFFKNFTPEIYASLLAKSRTIIGNSSSGLRESAYLGVPSINIGTRQRLREHSSNVKSVDYSSKEIIEAFKYHYENNYHYKKSTLFGDGTAGKKIADALVKCDLNVIKTLNFDVIK